MRVVSVRRLEEKKRVFDVEVGGLEHYVLSNGVVSHNSGGGGAKYAGDAIVFLSKRKEKVGTEVVGNVIHVFMYKSRLAKENTYSDVLLTYSGGLDRYYGLFEVGLKGGVFAKYVKPDGKESNRFVVNLPDGTQSKPFYQTEVLRDPEKFYTPEVLAAVEEAAAAAYKYGRGDPAAMEEDLEVDMEKMLNPESLES